MGYVMIDHWDAVEIFCNVICKYDKKRKISDFQQNHILLEELNKYSKGLYPGKVSAKVFGKKTNKIGHPALKRPKSFYEFGRKIRNGIPITLDKDELEGYLKFIGASISQYSIKYFSEWLPSDKQRRFEGTTWLLYYFHQVHEDKRGQQPESTAGIARAVLHIKPFGKAEIIGFEDSECYEGVFQLYGKEEKFIKFEMKLKGSKEKDLHLLIYIGTGMVRLALGQFHNLGRAIYSGTIMMEHINKMDIEEDHPKFFGIGELNQLPSHVQKYFKDKKQNVLRVPTKLTSVADFEKWHGLKNKDL